MNAKTRIFVTTMAIAVVTAIAVAYQWRQINQLRDRLAELGGNTSNSAKKTYSAQASTLNLKELARILALPDKLLRVKSLIDFAGTLGPADLKAALEIIGKLPSSSDNDIATSILMARLVELDARGALAWANGQPNTKGRSALLETLFNSWSSIDPASALKAIGQINDVAIRNRLFQTTLENLASTDPQSAFNAMKGLSPGMLNPQIINAVFSTWASNDPDAAAAAALGLTANANRVSAVEDVLKGWAEIDPEAALAWAASLPKGSIRAVAMTSALSNLAQLDPKAATDYASTIPLAQNRNQLMSAVAAAWGKNDPAAALAWVDTFPSTPAHDAAIQSILTELSQTDPKTAAADLGQITNQAQRNLTMADIATNWGMQDMPAAMNWMLNQPRSADVARDMKSLIYDMGESDPAGAAAYTQTLIGNSHFDYWIEGAETMWLNADGPAALAWAQSMPPDQGGNAAMTFYIVENTGNDPQGSLTAALQMPAGQYQTTAITDVVYKWANLDPASAAPAILADIPPGPDQNSAITQVAQNWIKQDQQAAAQWIDSLPASPARDSAVSQLVITSLRTDPATAFQWANSIGTDAMRANQINQVVNYWSQKDPAAAAAAVQNANLTDQQRTNLLNKLSIIAQRVSN